MITLEFFRWWYGRGWALAFKRLEHKIQGIERAFSVGILLRTLFAPWRRVVTYPGASLAEHYHAFIDNLISRVVGFTVRISVLISAVLVTIIFGTMAVIACLLWPLLPILAVAALAWSIAG